MDGIAIKPFAFLSLPKELRLMIYDFIPVLITREIHRRDGNILVEDPCCDMAILRTSSIIYEEALPILLAALQRGSEEGVRYQIRANGPLFKKTMVYLLRALEPSIHMSFQWRNSRSWGHWAEFDRTTFLARAERRGSEVARLKISFYPGNGLDNKTRQEFVEGLVMELWNFRMMEERYDFFVMNVWNGTNKVPLRDHIQVLMQEVSNDVKRSQMEKLRNWLYTG